MESTLTFNLNCIILIMPLTVILKMDIIVTAIMVPIASLNREANVQLIKLE